MSEMVERVAAVLRVKRRCDPSMDFPCPFCEWTEEGQDVRTKQTGDYEVGCMYLARAAIEAMREPTQEMIEAGTEADWAGEIEGRAGDSIMDGWQIGDNDLDPPPKRPGIWPAMIDAALK